MPEINRGAGPALKCDKLWVVVGDIHQQAGNFHKIPELAQASEVLVSGDLTNEGGPGEASQVLDALMAPGIPVLAQFGNMDKGEINDWLNDKNINLHAKVREIAPGVVLLGIGGSTFTPMHTCTEFSEDAYAAWLEEEWAEAKNYSHKILISHNPPKDTLCDAINPDLHVGSQAVRSFIEKYQPDLCICGHIHEGRAMDKIGRTTIINPGMLADGGYALICYRDGRLEGELRIIEAE